MSSAAAQPTVTPEQYLAQERRAEYKSEYISGYVVAMAGASRVHNLIALNIAAELRLQLRGRPCETYMVDMRVKVDRTGLYTYPDVVVACGDIHFEDTGNDTLINPVVIVEVLSDSTEAYDRGEKFAHYRRLDSLQAYVLVTQNRPRIEQYTRQGSQWLLSEANGLGETVSLPAIGCDLVLAEVYDRVQFAEQDPFIRPLGGTETSR
jgi:Uma2 family endonuclease